MEFLTTSSTSMEWRCVCVLHLTKHLGDADQQLVEVTCQEMKQCCTHNSREEEDWWLAFNPKIQKCSSQLKDFSMRCLYYFLDNLCRWVHPHIQVSDQVNLADFSDDSLICEPVFSSNIYVISLQGSCSKETFYLWNTHLLDYFLERCIS